MVTLTADVTSEIKGLTRELLKTGMYKSQSEIVRDAIRQLAYKYNVSSAPSIREVREIIGKASKKSGKSLSGTLKALREE